MRVLFPTGLEVSIQQDKTFRPFFVVFVEKTNLEKRLKRLLVQFTHHRVSYSACEEMLRNGSKGRFPKLKKQQQQQPCHQGYVVF